MEKEGLQKLWRTPADADGLRYVNRVMGKCEVLFFSLCYALARRISVTPTLRPVNHCVQRGHASNTRTPVGLQSPVPER